MTIMQEIRMGISLLARWFGAKRDIENEKREKNTINYQDRIIRDPRVCGGQLVIKGTRVTLSTVLSSLAEGASVAEILTDFPSLTEEDVRAAIALARADLNRGDHKQ